MKSLSIAIPFLLTVIAILLTPCPSAAAKTIQFSGFDWEIRPSEKSGGPGPNRWDENNVSVDADGHLHLKLTERGGRWYCAEVTTQKSPGIRPLPVPDCRAGGPARPQCRVRAVQLSRARGRPGRHERDRHRVRAVGQTFRTDRQLHGVARPGRLGPDQQEFSPESLGDDGPTRTEFRLESGRCPVPFGCDTTEGSIRSRWGAGSTSLRTRTTASPTRPCRFTSTFGALKGIRPATANRSSWLSARSPSTPEKK